MQTPEFEKRPSGEAAIRQDTSFLTLAENTFDIVTRHGKDFRYLYVNKAVEIYTGITAADFIGKTYRELGLPEEVCRIWDRQLSRAFETRAKCDVEFEMPGGTAHIHSRLIPEFDTSGEMTSVLVISTEISEKRKSAENIRKLASHLQLATEAANIGTWLYDSGTDKLEWSPSHKSMWGWGDGAGEFELAHWYELIHPDDREKTLKAFGDFLKRDSIYDVEYRIFRKNDRVMRWIRSVGKFHFQDPDEANLISGISIDISAQKQNEERLLQGEKQFRGTFENAAVGMAHVSPDGKWLRVNNRLCEIVGYAQAELLGLTFQDITFPDDIETDMSFVSHLLAGRLTNYSIEKRYVHKKGYIVWAALTVSLSRDVYDRPEYFISVIQDISERKEAEEAVRKSNERYQLINRATQDAIWDWDLLTNEVIWNEAAYTMFGYSRDQVGSDAEWWSQSVHPDDRQLVLEGIHRVIDAGGSSWSGEYRFACGDGSYKTVFDRGFILHNQSGRSIRMVGSMQDISERKEIVARLEQNEQRFRTLANSISQLAWIANGNGWIFWYNQRWYDYTGTTLEEMQGWGWQKVHHPEHVQRVLDFSEQAWFRDEPFEITFPLRGKDGSYRWFLTRAYPVKDSQGNIVQWIGTNTDIHDQKTLAEKLETIVAERTRELQRSNDDLQQFAHIVSHDLKEPVRKIKTFGNRLEGESSADLNDKSRLYLQKILHASDRLTQMIEGTLAYSTISAKNDAMEEVDLNKVIAEIEKDLEVLIQEKHARIVSNNLPTLRAMKFLIYQLFYNLINNSLKFARSGEPPFITVSSLRKSEHLIEITVKDNGIGFDQIYADKIFNAYTRLNSKDKFEGTGLGLALCKKIVERHGGEITAKSKAGEGASFMITLPLPQKES